MDIKDGVFEGGEAYAVPLLARVESIDNLGHQEFALLRGVFEDGTRVFVPIATRAAEVLVRLLSTHLTEVAQRQAHGETKH